MWLSSQLSILRKSFLLMRRGFLQQQRRLEYLSKLFTSTWTAHSSSVHSAIAACGHLRGRGVRDGSRGTSPPSMSPCSRTRGGRARGAPSLKACMGVSTATSPRVTASPQKGQKTIPHGKAKGQRGAGLPTSLLVQDHPNKKPQKKNPPCYLPRLRGSTRPAPTAPPAPPGRPPPHVGRGRQLWRRGRGGCAAPDGPRPTVPRAH